jgi:prevent-host-death family protein
MNADKETKGVVGVNRCSSAAKILIFHSSLNVVRLYPLLDQTRSGLCYNLNMVVRNISQAKAELSALIEEVQKGNEVILAKAGKPVAKLVAYRGPARPRTPGSMAGQIWIAPDFDTLPDDMAEALGMTEPRS